MIVCKTKLKGPSLLLTDLAAYILDMIFPRKVFV